MTSRTVSMLGMIFLLGLVAEFAWGKGPVKFCASFEDRDHYRLLLVDELDSLPDIQSDAQIHSEVVCDNPFWVHSFWPGFEGFKRTNFSRYNYDLGNPKDLDRQCQEKILATPDSLKKKNAPRLEWNLKFIEAPLYERRFAKDFLRPFYNKIFTGYWMADLVCVCPHFEVGHQSRNIKAKLVGECKLDFKKEMRVIPPDYKPQYFEDEDYEEEVPARIENPDWIPCYERNWSKNNQCKIVNYASQKTLPVHGKISAIDESLECHKIDGKYYLNYATNIPRVSLGTWIDYRRCYTDSVQCNGDDAPVLKTPFYSCEKFNLKDGGCETVTHGLDVVVDENLRYEGWKRDGMIFFFDMKSSTNLENFLESIFFTHGGVLEKAYRELLPEGVSEKEILRLGDEASSKASGMFFYDGSVKVRYEKFEKPKFKMLKDAMNYCKNAI